RLEQPQPGVGQAVAAVGVDPAEEGAGEVDGAGHEPVAQLHVRREGGIGAVSGAHVDMLPVPVTFPVVIVTDRTIESVTMSTTTIPLTTGTWTLDPVHSSVAFTIRHLGVTNVRGRFDRFEGHLDVGPTLGEVHLNASVDLTSVNTNNADRDAH